jgi:hypothetical protein
LNISTWSSYDSHIPKNLIAELFAGALETAEVIGCRISEHIPKQSPWWFEATGLISNLC